MFGVRTLRIRSSLLASAVAVATVAAALAAGTGSKPEVANDVAKKSDRLPIAVKVSCPVADCIEQPAPGYRTVIETDRERRTTVLTRVPIED